MTNDKILEILSSDLNPSAQRLMLYAIVAKIDNPSALTIKSTKGVFSASTISRYKDTIDWDDVKNLIGEETTEEKAASSEPSTATYPISSYLPLAFEPTVPLSEIVPSAPFKTGNQQLYQTCVDEIEGALCDQVRDGKIRKEDCDFTFGTPSVLQVKKAIEEYRTWKKTILEGVRSFDEMKETFNNPDYKITVLRGVWAMVNHPTLWNEDAALSTQDRLNRLIALA